MGARSVRNPLEGIPVQGVDSELRSSLHPIFECGVDWITVTCNDPDNTPRFDELGYRLLADEASSGNQIRPWSMRGFEGLNGGHVAVGKCNDMSLIRLSSKLAWSTWRQPYELSTNCSRIDLQVTVSGVSDIDEFLCDREREAWTHANKFKRPPHVEFRFSNRTGSTLYLGARTSDSFARLYNKWSESKLDHYEGCVRCEVQFQNETAKRMAFRLHQAESDTLEACGAVSRWIDNRGLSQLFAGEPGKLISCPRSRTTTEKRLAWLDKQVRPAVTKLLETCDRAQVLRALGLCEQAPGEIDHVGQLEKRR